MNEVLKKYIKGDKIIWYVIIALSVFSSLVVYSATGNLAYKHHDGNALYYLFRHAKFLVMGIGLIVAVHHMNYKWFGRIATALLYLSIILLLITLVMGINLNDANRWLTIPVIGFSFQPSELAKFALMLYLAKVLAQNQHDDQSADDAFVPAMLHVGVVCLLIFSEDFSTALLIGAVSLIVLFIGRVSVKYIAGTIAIGVVGITIVIMSAEHIPFLHRATTWKARVMRHLNSDEANEEYVADYQSERSKMAIATGGLFGKGPGNSHQRYFLPHPYSDFVYAIITEEFGLLGAAVVMLAYLILLFRCGVIVRASNRTFPALMVVGLATLLSLQAFINMGVAVGVFPVTGQPLPLISMGGTSTLFTCLALGAILSVSRNNMEEKSALENEVKTVEA